MSLKGISTINPLFRGKYAEVFPYQTAEHPQGCRVKRTKAAQSANYNGSALIEDEYPDLLAAMTAVAQDLERRLALSQGEYTIAMETIEAVEELLRSRPYREGERLDSIDTPPISYGKPSGK